MATHNRRLAKTLGLRLALSACAVLTLVATTATPSRHTAADSSSHAGTFRAGIKLVDNPVDSPVIPEVDIIANRDGSWPDPPDFFSDPGDANMETVTVYGTRPPAPTCTFTGLSNLADLIIQNENSKPYVYTDSQGHPTVGVGFNLDRPDAPKVLASVGANYELVRLGEAILNQQQINQLLGADIAAAITRAQHYFPNLTSLSPGQQSALIDMSFNLANKLSQFKNLMADVAAGNNLAAANDMLKSLWAFQVGSRAVQDSDNMLKCQ